MSGYRWQPWIRYTPRNGVPSYIKLADVFTDAAGPTRIDLDYVMDVELRTDVERRRSVLARGWRAAVRFTVELATTADHAAYATLLSRLMQPELWKVELALDALNYREVLLSRSDGPTALAGKAHVGARFTFTLEAVELAPELYAWDEAANVRNHLQDGGLEQWTTANDLQAWAENVGATGFFAEESSTVYEGARSARMLKTASEELILVQGDVHLKPARYYTLSGAVRSASAVAQALRFVIFNFTKLKYLNADGRTWQSGSTAALEIDGVNSWTVGSLELLVDPSFHETDNIQCYCRYPAANGINVNVYWDALSLSGPHRPTGITRW